MTLLLLQLFQGVSKWVTSDWHLPHESDSWKLNLLLHSYFILFYLQLSIFHIIFSFAYFVYLEVEKAFNILCNDYMLLQLMNGEEI